MRSRFSCVFALACFLSAAPVAFAQGVVEWTVQSNSNNLGLGYPIPIPVDTAEPFDGFRTYDGLFTRHQDLMMSQAHIQGQVVGETDHGRDIWAYQLSDENDATVWGAPESSMLVNGGIHAREWQSPEVMTGIMERFAENSADQHIHQYLMENANIVVVPVNNVDGFNMTQAFPTENYLGTDPDDPGGAPRDGRMRRKNMLNVDEDLFTSADHLQGVDLNRNNSPFWATSGSSSSDTRSIVYHGVGAESEPETQARLAAADWAGTDRLRLYIDLHSFSQLFFSINTTNSRRNNLQATMISRFVQHQAAFPANKLYLNRPNTPGFGIGATDGYFAYTYEIPSATLELEPSGGFHFNLPGTGADYGGLNENTHDGFILPESEITRVREQVAESFLTLFYYQAGPPSLRWLRVNEVDTGAVVLDAEWDAVGPEQRQLYLNQLQPMTPGQSYHLWLGFDKPMRWVENGEPVTMQGQNFDQNLGLALQQSGQAVGAMFDPPEWLSTPGSASSGFQRYIFDGVTIPFELTGGDFADGVANLLVTVRDMLGLQLDADPATVVDWRNGAWHEFENKDGLDGDAGGADSTIVMQIQDQNPGLPFLAQAGSSAALYDPSHEGEGFLVEILDEERALVYWFTYDNDGNQRWFFGVARIVGNELIVDDLLQTGGGQFGADFDPDSVTTEAKGNLRIVFDGCDSAEARHRVNSVVTRQSLQRIARLDGLSCESQTTQKRQVAKAGQGIFSGTWFDLAHTGEGFLIEVLDDDLVLVYWFTYDANGNQAWLFGVGTIGDGHIEIADMFITSGGGFGDDFDPETVVAEHWGSAEFDLACDAGSMSYESVFSEYGSGEQALTRNTILSGLSCP